MKKILIPIGTLFLSGLAYSQNQASSAENYIQSKTYLKAVTISSDTVKQANTVQYFDGLGRPKQVVNVKASPSGKDVVQHIEYDGFGRQVKDYLPVPQQGTQNGAIYTSPLSNATQPTLYGAEKIYSEKILENSPLDRILQQKQVGNAWDGKPVNFGYDANTTADAVKKYTTVTTWVSGASSSVLSQSSNYAAAQLYKNTVTDEDGNITIEFKNGEGQVLLVRKMNGTQSVDTYYVYNEYNQLAYVIPPLASVSGAVDNVTLDNLCYQYKYDGRNRLIEKKLPGKGWEYMLFDKQDRQVGYQDAGLRGQNKWLCTKYDKYGRVVYTCMLTYGESRAFFQDILDTEVNNPSNNEQRSATGFNKSGIQIYYTTAAFPGLGANDPILTVNYYDTYPTSTPTIPTQILGQNVLSQDAQNSSISTKSLPVASYVKNIEDDNWTKNYIWYDKKGRAIGTYSFNHLGGYTKTESLLDFAGIVQKTDTYHLRKQGELGITVNERFVYDNQNRLWQHWHKVDNNAEILLTENIYNELSQLVNKQVGNNLQSIDYAYNIRGWMTDINKNQMTIPNLDGKLFAYKIRYNERLGIINPDPSLFSGKDVEAKYNGNIAEVDWRTVENIGNNPSTTPKRYSYAYDKLNRLTAGYYQNPQNPGSKENTESIDYDLNGNITNLYRTSVIESGNTPTVIDKLVYTYENSNNSNRLAKIIDDAQNTTGYEGGGQTIGYDVNGNMINMPDKGISVIKYNHLNLPHHLEYSRDGIEMVKLDTEYRADGTKLRKVNATTISGINGYTTSVKTIDYLDGFQYQNITNSGGGGGGSSSFSASNLESSRAMETQAFSLVDIGGLEPIGMIKNSDLQFFPTAEGFYDYQKDQYIYQYKDHLGNTRVSFGRNSAGALEIVDANDYYPFGMNHLKSGNSFFGSSSYKNYKYNGKELQESGQYDYGARFYMADIGRWGVIDPRSQYTHEAYSYVWNNPINFWDPTGMEGEDPDPKKIYGPKGGKLIEEVVVTASKPLQTNTAGLSFTHKAFAPAIPVAAYLLEAAYYALVGYAAWDIADKASDVIKNRDLSEQNDAEETASGTPDVFPDAGEETDINGVPVPVDDSGIKKPIDFLAFSKVARGNQRDTGLIGWSDEDIDTELAGLKGNLSKEQKALKQRLVKEQKARTTRNKQKKSGEKGTGTGRR
ncbi:DUF6443 domain-containing protein [Chryseobacterium mucoviscidosis]|uniref:DUF6443 domain-containing protein n=1 Tax=Chryseobacterium mucoviscidosis TaxID=1945581 RepID=UPI0031D26C43